MDVLSVNSLSQHQQDFWKHPSLYFVNFCSQVVDKPLYWAGSEQTSPTTAATQHLTCPSNSIPSGLKDKATFLCFKSNSTDHVYKALTAINEGTEFLNGKCVRGFCSHATLLESQAIAFGISPPAPKSTACKKHRRGPLCGQCEKGYALRPFYMVRCTIC